ncbi:hypothetical protein J3Q64DRAFT_1182194 [Phycomyces blakesleeanus]|uniref:C2H2-type domain-containing protein n=1 Tax=Phycomyces blakesleeanus TaxID=4837 RepID=A0ABR3AX77_PHYBL
MREIDFPSPLSKPTHHYQEEYTYALHEYPRSLPQMSQMSMHSVVSDNTLFHFTQSVPQDAQPISSQVIASPPITIPEDGNHNCPQYISPSTLTLSPTFRSDLQEPLYTSSELSMTTLEASVIAMQAMHHSPDQLFYDSPLSVDMSPLLETNQDELHMIYSVSPDEHLLSLIVPHEGPVRMDVEQSRLPMQSQAQSLVDFYPVQEPLLSVQSDHPNRLVNSNISSMQSEQQTIQLQMDSRQIQQQMPHRLHHSLHHHSNHTNQNHQNHQNHHHHHHTHPHPHQNYQHQLHDQIFNEKHIQDQHHHRQHQHQQQQQNMFNTIIFGQQSSDQILSPRSTPESTVVSQAQRQTMSQQITTAHHHQQQQQRQQKNSKATLVSRQGSPLVTATGGGNSKVKIEDRQTDRKPLDAVIAGVTQHQHQHQHHQQQHQEQQQSPVSQLVSPMSHSMTVLGVDEGGQLESSCSHILHSPLSSSGLGTPLLQHAQLDHPLSPPMFCQQQALTDVSIIQHSEDNNYNTQQNMKRGLPADADAVHEGVRNKVRRKAAKTSPQRSPATNKGHGPDSGNKSQHGRSSAAATHDPLHKDKASASNTAIATTTTTTNNNNNNTATATHNNNTITPLNTTPTDTNPAAIDSVPHSTFFNDNSKRQNLDTCSIKESTLSAQLHFVDSSNMNQPNKKQLVTPLLAQPHMMTCGNVISKEFDGMSREQLIARLINLEAEKRAGSFHSTSSTSEACGYKKESLVDTVYSSCSSPSSPPPPGVPAPSSHPYSNSIHGHTEEIEEKEEEQAAGAAATLSNQHRSEKSTSPREMAETEEEIKREGSNSENISEDLYKCQWTDCGQVFSVMQEFISHISDTHVGSGKVHKIYIYIVYKIYTPHTHT